MNSNPNFFINSIKNREKNCYPKDTIEQYENEIISHLYNIKKAA